MKQNTLRASVVLTSQRVSVQAELLEERKHAQLGRDLTRDVVPGENKLRHAAAVDLGDSIKKLNGMGNSGKFVKGITSGLVTDKRGAFRYF